LRAEAIEKYDRPDELPEKMQSSGLVLTVNKDASHLTFVDQAEEAVAFYVMNFCGWFFRQSAWTVQYRYL
jgi:uncharacterized protein YneR